MKVTDIWKSGKKPVISFELFPAKSKEAAEKLDNTIDKLMDLQPGFFSVTFGAGGGLHGKGLITLSKIYAEKKTQRLLRILPDTG